MNMKIEIGNMAEHKSRTFTITIHFFFCLIQSMKLEKTWVTKVTDINQASKNN